MTRAFEDLFTVPDAFQGIPMPGRTDSWILADAAAVHGIPSAQLSRFHDVYLAYLAKELDRPGPRKGVMPGVRPLLDDLAARADVYLALLTGNYEAAARLKLEYFDLWRYFRCGAFGDAAPDRNGLLPKALAAVRACCGRCRFLPRTLRSWSCTTNGRTAAATQRAFAPTIFRSTPGLSMSPTHTTP